MKIKLILFFLFTQFGFGQTAFVRCHYSSSCSYVKELTPKEITDFISVQKNNDGFKIVLKIPIEKESDGFVQISLETHDTEFQDYRVGQDGDKDWKSSGYISMKIKSKCDDAYGNSSADSRGFIELKKGLLENQISVFFDAGLDRGGVIGDFKNINVN